MSFEADVHLEADGKKKPGSIRPVQWYTDRSNCIWDWDLVCREDPYVPVDASAHPCGQSRPLANSDSAMYNVGNAIVSVLNGLIVSVRTPARDIPNTTYIGFRDLQVGCTTDTFLQYALLALDKVSAGISGTLSWTARKKDAVYGLIIEVCTDVV